MPFLKLSLIFLVSALQVIGGSRALADVEAVPGPQAQQVLDFDDLHMSPKTSLSQQMVLFEMPPEYECPLFSNSAYTEILTSLDRMQENFNALFPTCDNKIQNDKILQKSVELRQAVFEAKKLQDSGQTFKLELSAQNLVDAAQKIQEALAIAAQTQTKACFRDAQQFRNTIFSINEAFQGIAPVVLDLVAKNPVLGAKLAPAVKILAGADSLSKGLNFVEQIAKDSVMFDMTDQNNRINTLKNVCQYMKLYRRLEYMRLLKLGQIQTVYSGYQSRIRDLNQNINDYRQKNKSLDVSKKPENSLTLNHAEVMAELNASDPNYQLFNSLKTLLPDELRKLQKVQYDLELAGKDLKRPEVAQCQMIQSARASTSFQTTAKKLFEFTIHWAQMGGAFESAEKIESLQSQMEAYQNYFLQAKDGADLQECVQLGQDLIKISIELLSEGQKMVHMYAQEQLELQDESDQIKQKKAVRKEREKQNAQSNLASLKSMIQYAAFESSEIEKRAKDMHKYFFKGPDQIQSECATGAKKDCTFMQSLSGGLKAYYQEYRNQGPIYELLLNNNLHFMNAYKQMTIARSKLAYYEYQFAEENYKAQKSSGQSYKDFLNEQRNFMNSMEHLSLKYLKKGSPLHQNLCMYSRQILDKYLVASSHLMSSQSLCNMIYPALKEQSVAVPLKNYCVPRAGKTEALDQPSKLQEMIYLLIGRGEKARLSVTSWGDSHREPLDVSNENSPKALVDKLIEKYDNLDCEQKSGF